MAKRARMNLADKSVVVEDIPPGEVPTIPPPTVEELTERVNRMEQRFFVEDNEWKYVLMAVADAVSFMKNGNLSQSDEAFTLLRQRARKHRSDDLGI